MLYRAGISVPVYELGYLTITVKDKGAYWQVLQVATALQSPLLRLYATDILEQEQEPPQHWGGSCVLCPYFVCSCLLTSFTLEVSD